MEEEELPIFSHSQLALHNGVEKEQVWIAYKGIIFDVTHSKLWRDGKHYEHWAGQDLTAELADSPHGERVFERFVPIGKLK